MRQVSEQFKNNFRKMTRSVQGKVVCSNATYLSTDYLQSFNLVTEGINGKMFGYTLSATLKVVLIKKDNNLYVPKVGDTITPYLGAEDEYMRYQHFYVDSVKIYALSALLC